MVAAKRELPRAGLALSCRFGQMRDKMLTASFAELGSYPAKDLFHKLVIYIHASKTPKIAIPRGILNRTGLMDGNIWDWDHGKPSLS